MKKVIELLQVIWWGLTYRLIKESQIPKKCPICDSDDIQIYGYNGGGWYCRSC